jgi:hypothetical protein
VEARSSDAATSLSFFAGDAVQSVYTRVATLKNLKYILICLHFLGYYMIPYVLFHSSNVFSILENRKMKKNP